MPLLPPVPLPVPSPTGFGISPVGLSPFGLGVPGTLFVVGATALSERTVRVELSLKALAVSTAGDGDALNARTWEVVRLDTNRSLLVLAVSKVDDTIFDLYTLHKFASSLITHRVSSATLRADAGGLISSPGYADFAGCEAKQITRSPAALVDLKNIVQSETELSGTLEVGSDGDYAVHGGVDFLRKLIIRRLTTLPGEFFHLTRDYGIGFRAKEPLPGVDLVRLRSAIVAQLEREPEFARVRVGLILSPDNVLTIEVAAQLRRSNEEVVIPISAQPVTSALVSL